MRIGVPSRTSSCLGRSAFIRRPAPAAAMMTPTFMMNVALVRNLGVSLALRCSFSRFAFGPLRPLLADRRMMIGALFFVAAEDHLSGSRLEHAGDRRFDGLANHLAGVVHNYHRSVVEVRDALIEFLAFLENENLHGF